MPHQSLDDALATLIAATRRSKRQSSLTQVNQALNTALSHLGSIDSIAERIGLSPRMLKQFSAIEDLKPSVKRMFSDRKLDSVDAAEYLSYFKPDYQILLAQQLGNAGLDTKDLRAAWEFIKRNPHTTPRRLIDVIKKSKATKVYVCEFVIRGALTPETVKRRIIATLGVGTVEKVIFDNPIGKILLNRKGKDALSKFCKREGIRLREAIVGLVYGSGA